MLAANSGEFDDDYSKKVCQKVAGPYFEEMLQSHEGTIARLQDADPRARLAALFMVRDYWKPFPGFADVCEKLAFEDDSVEVRGGALSTLCGCIFASYDLPLGKRLARLVRDDKQLPLHRRLAYTALESLWHKYNASRLNGTFQFPDNVDWHFVDMFFTRSEPPSELEKVNASSPLLSEKSRKAIALFREAEIAIGRGDAETAIRLLSESIDLCRTAGPLCRRGRLYLDAGRMNDAIADFTEAIKRSPDFIKCYEGRAEAYERAGLHEQARLDRQKVGELAKTK